MHIAGGKLRSAEFAREAQHGSITFTLHCSDDVPHGLLHRGRGLGAAIERTQEARVVFIARTDDAHTNIMNDARAAGNARLTVPAEFQRLGDVRMQALVNRASEGRLLEERALRMVGGQGNLDHGGESRDAARGIG